MRQTHKTTKTKRKKNSERRERKREWKREETDSMIHTRLFRCKPLIDPFHLDVNSIFPRAFHLFFVNGEIKGK